MVTHVVIPDTQCRPGVPADHLVWIGRWIHDHLWGQPDVRLIQLGDHWDMSSLSSWDRGTVRMEGRRLMADLAAGETALGLLDEAIQGRRRGRWQVDRVLLEGNHENRYSRFCAENSPLSDLRQHLSLPTGRWRLVPYLQPEILEGVAYAHAWIHPMTGRTLGGTAAHRLRHLGYSYTMGHQQTLDYAVRCVLTPRGPVFQHGLIAGACYLHHEEYSTPQGGGHWRGIVVCRGVRDGDYDLQLISLGQLCREYTGVPIVRFRPKIVL